MKQPLPPQYENAISQRFGVNPQAYAAFGLLGHNGLDYAVPVGTPVYTIDGGSVAEVADDPDGYGRYVKLTHTWGESIYAHLNTRSVVVNQAVAPGQQLATSGNTGNSTGPHLHLGTRINPNYRDDGWNGYSDPQVVLRNVKPRRYWIGPHLAGPRVGEMIGEIGRWKPSAAIYLDPSPDQVRQIRATSPETKIVGRIYRPDSEVADHIKASPDEAAHWIDGIIRSHPAYGLCDYWQVANEVCQVAWGEFTNLCETMVRWQELARGGQSPYKCAIFAFSVGNPDMPVHDRMGYWRQAVPALETAILNGNVLLLHQYGAKTLWQPDADWYINRWENQIFPRLGYLDKERSTSARAAVPTLKAIRMICGEYGIDGLIVGEKKGWRSYTSAADYANQLISMGRYTERWPGNAGYCVYTCGHASGEWADYDIWPEVARLLADEAVRLAPRDDAAVLKAAAAEAQCLYPNPDAALQKVMFADGFIPVGNETEVTTGGLVYICQKADSLSTGASRCYYVVKGDWANVEWTAY